MTLNTTHHRHLYLFIISLLIYTSISTSPFASVSINVDANKIDAHIEEFGIFPKAENVEIIDNPNTPSGITKISDSYDPLIPTDRIPLELGTEFGFCVLISNLGTAKDITITKDVAHPLMVHPDGKESKGYSYEDTLSVSSGEVYYCPTYTFDEKWEMNEGEWVFSVLHKKKILAKKIFFAYQISKEKQKQIDQILALSSAENTGKLFSQAWFEQMSEILTQAKPNIEPKAFDILEDEMNLIIDDELIKKNVLNKISYPIYDKHLSSSDLAKIIESYETPVGQKLVQLLPVITQEAMQAGQAWGQSLGPIIEQRVLDRFEKEGIAIN